MVLYADEPVFMVYASQRTPPLQAPAQSEDEGQKILTVSPLLRILEASIKTGVEAWNAKSAC